MRLPCIVEQDYSFIIDFIFFKQLFGSRYVLDETIKNIVYNKNILKGLAALEVIGIHNFGSQYTKWDCCLLVNNYGIENEFGPRYNLRIVCQLRQSLQ